MPERGLWRVFLPRIDIRSLENASAIRSQNEGFGGPKNPLESGFRKVFETALERLEKSLKNPIYSITCSRALCARRGAFFVA
jgi:hypothetical protein